MNKGDYQWYVTFSKPGYSQITLSEMHPDFKTFSQGEGIEMVSASLINLNKFSLLDPEDKQMDAIVHHVSFKPGTKLHRLFRRVEKGILSGSVRIVPSLEYEHDGTTKYIFSFPDKIFITENSRFYRRDT